MGVGLRLKKILKEKEMTIKELSQLSNIPINTLYSITKRDSQRVDNVLLQKIADTLDIPVTKLQYDGVINFSVRDLKNPEDMSPDEFKKYMNEDFPAAMDRARNRMAEVYGKLVEIKGEEMILQSFAVLNKAGRIEAIKRTHELTQLEEYTVKDVSTDDHPTKE